MIITSYSFTFSHKQKQAPNNYNFDSIIMFHFWFMSQYEINNIIIVFLFEKTVLS